MEITRKIVKQPFAPDTTDVLWLDSSGDSDVLKSFCNGQWKEVAGGTHGTQPLILKGTVDEFGTFTPDDDIRLVEVVPEFLNGRSVLFIAKDPITMDIRCAVYAASYHHNGSYGHLYSSEIPNMYNGYVAWHEKITEASEK